MSISPIGGGMQSQGPQSQKEIAAKAKQAVAKGVQDAGPVTPVKPSSDQSGANGTNDYFSALGYNG